MLRMPPEAFVGQAYLEILGRPADPAGYSRYLRLVRSGRTSRRRLLVRELAQSGEARSRSGALSPPFDATDWTLEALVAGDETTFIERSHMVVKRRLPDDNWRAHCAASLRAGVPRSVLLGELRFSAEGVAWDVRIRGLRRALMWHRVRGSLSSHSEAPAKSTPPTPQAVSVVPPLAARSQTLASTEVGGPLAVFTIAASNYLPQVRVLMASVRTLHPDFRLYLVLADMPAGSQAEDFTILPAESLGVPCFDDMSVRYNVLEFCTALKPFAFLHFFNQIGAEKVLYLDPDTRLYAPLRRVQELLSAEHSFVLTPHITQPLEDDCLPDDHQFLRTGVFNLGFAAARRCNEAHNFIEWWAEKLRTRCTVNFSDNLFTDQRWCDLAPCFLPRLFVLREPGFNVAYWNLAHRPLSQDARGQWFAGSEPLVFFHFSGLDSNTPARVSKHQNRLRLSDMPGAQPLFDDYIDAVKQARTSEDNLPSWGYGIADNGAALPETVRAFYRAQHGVPDPAPRAELLAALRRMSTGAVPVAGVAGEALPGLLMHQYKSRADLQRAFDLSDPADVQDLRAWYEHSAIHADGLAAYLTTETLAP